VFILKVKGIEPLIRKFKNFHRDNPKAVAFSMNKAGGVATTASLLKAKSAWNLRTSDLKKKVKIKRANVGKSVYVFKMHSTPINLNEFYAKELKSGGVSYKIQKKSKKMRNAFIKGKSKRNTFVLTRVGKERFPLLPHFSITPSYMFTQAKAEKEFVTTFFRGKGGKRGFTVEYKAQLKRLLKKSP